MQSPAGGAVCLFPSILLSSGSVLSSKPKEAGKFLHRPYVVSVWFGPLPGRLICECAQLQCTRRPNHRAVFCFSTGYTCPKSRVVSCCRLRFVWLLEDCTLQINQRVQLCVLRTCGSWKVTKLIFFSFGGRGQLYKIVFPSKWAFSVFTSVIISQSVSPRMILGIQH